MYKLLFYPSIFFLNELLFGEFFQNHPLKLQIESMLGNVRRNRLRESTRLAKGDGLFLNVKSLDSSSVKRLRSSWRLYESSLMKSRQNQFHIASDNKFYKNFLFRVYINNLARFQISDRKSLQIKSMIEIIFLFIKLKIFINY